MCKKNKKTNNAKALGQARPYGDMRPYMAEFLSHNLKSQKSPQMTSFKVLLFYTEASQTCKSYSLEKARFWLCSEYPKLNADSDYEARFSKDRENYCRASS